MILKVEAEVADGKLSLTLIHPERREDWLAVQQGMKLVRDELDRILSGEHQCPFRPKDRP